MPMEDSSLYEGWDKADMIVVMGTTGSGKSYLINKLAGRAVVQEGASLQSCTEKCVAVPAVVGKTRVILIDTPGFDDTNRSDAEVLRVIADSLAAQHVLGYRLKGIMFVHRITDPRYTGSNLKTLQIFTKICGEASFGNVLLVTSRWGEIPEALGASREKELQESFWSYMIGKGSLMSRFYGDEASAIVLASQLLQKSAVVLRLTHEMAIDRKDLASTDAGMFVDEGLKNKQVEYRKDLDALALLRDQKMDRRVARDAERNARMLQQTEEQRERLGHHVYEEVEEVIEVERRAHQGYSWRLIRYVPDGLRLLAMLPSIVRMPESLDQILRSIADKLDEDFAATGQ